jgi:ATP-binding cassette subfamily F protein 3
MLQVSNLSKAYGDDVILEDVSFVVNPGERVGLVGPNGCGKTTLLRIIVGQGQPDRGSVRFLPADVTVGDVMHQNGWLLIRKMLLPSTKTQKPNRTLG